MKKSVWFGIGLYCLSQGAANAAPAAGVPSLSGMIGSVNTLLQGIPAYPVNLGNLSLGAYGINFVPVLGNFQIADGIDVLSAVTSFQAPLTGMFPPDLPGLSGLFVFKP